jgi:DNA-binding CsgD family transcriptional regulator
LERASITETWVSETTSYFSLIYLRGRGRLRIAKGELQQGLADMRELGRRCELSRERNPAQHPWRSDAAHVLLALGETNEARTLAAEEVDLARRFGAPSALAAALRAHGLAQGGDTGLRTLQEAAAVIERSPCALTKAKVLADLGAALRRANQRAAAHDPLQRALELAERCGATPVVEYARAELQAAGARPRSIVRTGVDSLTAAERRVCELAAAGKSNPEIAQSLFVTRGTVESHLHSAYRMLDIDSRAALRHALSQRAAA